MTEEKAQVADWLVQLPDEELRKKSSIQHQRRRAGSCSDISSLEDSDMTHLRPLQPLPDNLSCNVTLEKTKHGTSSFHHSHSRHHKRHMNRSTSGTMFNPINQNDYFKKIPVSHQNFSVLPDGSDSDYRLLSMPNKTIGNFGNLEEKTVTSYLIDKRCKNPKSFFDRFLDRVRPSRKQPIPLPRSSSTGPTEFSRALPNASNDCELNSAKEAWFHYGEDTVYNTSGVHTGDNIMVPMKTPTSAWKSSSANQHKNKRERHSLNMETSVEALSVGTGENPISAIASSHTVFSTKRELHKSLAGDRRDGRHRRGRSRNSTRIEKNYTSCTIESVSPATTYDSGFASNSRGPIRADHTTDDKNSKTELLLGNTEYADQNQNTNNIFCTGSLDRSLTKQSGGEASNSGDSGVAMRSTLSPTETRKVKTGATNSDQEPKTEETKITRYGGSSALEPVLEINSVLESGASSASSVCGQTGSDGENKSNL